MADYPPWRRWLLLATDLTFLIAEPGHVAVHGQVADLVPEVLVAAEGNKVVVDLLEIGVLGGEAIQCTGFTSRMRLFGCTSVDMTAAVDVDRRSGDIGGEVGGEEQAGSGDVGGLAGPLQRYGRDDVFELFGGDIAVQHAGLDH
jgi:hypothetical protein